MKPALLVLDPQNDFFEGDNSELAEFRRVVPHINEAISLFRDRNWLIVFIQDFSASNVPGSFERELYGGIDYRPGDIMIRKMHQDAFLGTRLDLLLSSYGVDMVVVCGFVLEYGVLETYRAALANDYQSALFMEGTASWSREVCEQAEHTCAVISLEDLQRAAEQHEHGRWHYANAR